MQIKYKITSSIFDLVNELINIQLNGVKNYLIISLKSKTRLKLILFACYEMILRKITYVLFIYVNNSYNSRLSHF